MILKRVKLIVSILLVLSIGLFLGSTVRTSAAQKAWEKIKWNEPQPMVERLSAERYILPKGWKEATKGVKKLVVYNSGGLAGDIATYMNMKRFEQMTGIKIIAVAVPPSVSPAKNLTTVVSRNPDVHILLSDKHFSETMYLVAGNWVTPLDVIYPPEVLKLFSPSIKDLYFDGHWWASPEVAVQFCNFYRKSWLENVGVAPPDTWQELYVAAAKAGNWAKQTFGAGYCGVVLPGGSAPDFSIGFRGALYSRGGQVYKNGKYDFTSIDVRKAFEYFVKLVKEGIAPEDVLTLETFGSSRVFGMGKAAFALSSTTSYIMKFQTEFPEIKGDWGLLGPLKWSEEYPDEYKVAIPTFNCGLVNKFADEKHKAAAMLYLSWLRSKEATRNELVVEGNETYFMSQYDDPDICQKVDWDFADQCAEELGLPHPPHLKKLLLLKTRKELVSKNRTVMWPAGGPEIVIHLQEHFGKAAKGRESIDEAIENLQKIATQISPR